MKFAYFVFPHIGGTYSVFKQLRKGLAEYGIEVCWLSVGAVNLREDPQWSSEMAYGTHVEAVADLTERERAKLLAKEIETAGYDGLFVSVLGDRIETNIVRYLPKNILRIMIVHNITPGTYAAAAAIRDHVHATVGVSRRCRSDLVAKFGFPAARTFSIANAVDTRGSRTIERLPRTQPDLRAIYLGRIEDVSKGVFWLPAILDGVSRNISLTIAGDGPDLPALRTKFAPQGDRVRFLGFVDPSDVFSLLLNHDVLIMPSRFEGFGLTIIEAMAAGCVPVVSRLDGVTDTIVDHGVNGFLFPVGTVRGAVESISALDRVDVWQGMSQAARTKAETAFTVERMAARYSEVIRDLQHTKPSIAAPLDLSTWSMPKGLRSGFRAFVPRPVKNWLRVAKERI